MFSILSLIARDVATDIVDNVFRDGVEEPAIGSVVYCDLALRAAEHSGIYVGGNEIVHLTKDGYVKRCSRMEFMEGTPAYSIYVSCIGNQPVGSEDAAQRALQFANTTRYRGYNVISNNCHMFSEWCLTGKENSSTFFTFLEHTSTQVLGVDTWRVWNRPDRGEHIQKYKTLRAAQEVEMQALMQKAAAFLAYLENKKNRG